MVKNRKLNLLITIGLIVVLCTTSLSLVYGKTEAQLREEAKAAAEKAAAATEDLEDAEAKLEELQVQIENNLAEIEKNQAEIDKKQKDIEEQTNDLGLRLTAMYKTSTVGYVDVILNSDDVPDLIANIGMVQKILSNDQKLLKALQKEHKKLEKMKADLDKKKAELEAAKIETEALKEKFQAEADKWAEQEKKLEAEANAAGAEAARNAAAARQQVIDNGGSTSGGYCWPTSTRLITDDYGWRICPFHGEEFHNGLDIGASTGCPIYAIQDGIITKAAWYGGYGNCVILNCGTGVSALYGHLSGYNCSYGQYVTKGQVIGYTGSTGNSTGPHLHFTVFDSNGDAFSPWSLY